MKEQGNVIILLHTLINVHLNLAENNRSRELDFIIVITYFEFKIKIPADI